MDYTQIFQRCKGWANWEPAWSILNARFLRWLSTLFNPWSAELSYKKKVFSI